MPIFCPRRSLMLLNLDEAPEMTALQAFQSFKAASEEAGDSSPVQRGGDISPDQPVIAFAESDPSDQALGQRDRDVDAPFLERRDHLTRARTVRPAKSIRYPGRKEEGPGSRAGDELDRVVGRGELE